MNDKLEVFDEDEEFDEEIEADEEDDGFEKMVEQQRRDGFGFRWDGLDEWQTDAIFAKLREWGVDTSPEQFPTQAQAAGEPSVLYKQWNAQMQQFAETHNKELSFWCDFPCIAAGELFERLTPEILCPESIANYFSDALENSHSKRHPVIKHDNPAVNAVLHLVDYMSLFPPTERSSRYSAVEFTGGMDLTECVNEAVLMLCQDTPEEAVQVGEFFSELPEFPILRYILTICLAKDRYRKLAIDRAQAGIEKFPRKVEEYVTASEVYRVLGDNTKALETAKLARELASGRIEIAAAERQIDAVEGRRLLRHDVNSTEDDSESIEIENDEYGVGESKPQTFKHEPSERQIRPNERCPCGSGKKYKKCCGSMV